MPNAVQKGNQKRNQNSLADLLLYFLVIRWGLSFQNSPTNLDIPYKMDLDFWIVFGGKKPGLLMAEIHKTDLAKKKHCLIAK